MSMADYHAILRSDFVAFVHRCFNELNPASPFLSNWHIEAMAGDLEAVRYGENRRLIINLPPRNLKSLTASVAFPAWVLGHDPSTQIVCASYGQELSDKLSRDTRQIMASRWYQDLFNTRLDGPRQAVQEFTTAQNGGRLATSVGGVLTGRGADFIIIDDPLKPDEALSDSQRETVNDWFTHTLYSRLNDKQNGRIVVIMQRLHENDLVAYLAAQGGWRRSAFPAIAEEDEVHIIRSPFGSRTHTRRIGDILHPERESGETLAQIRSTLGEYNFAGQYQQAPAPLGGGIIKLEWLRYYDQADLPDAFDKVIQSWDTANKPGEFNDHSVCTTWGISGRKIYLLNVWRKRVNYPDLKRAVAQQAHEFGVRVILIEDKASGTQLIQELKEDEVYCVPYKPELDKLSRLHAQTATIENGRVFLPREAHWLAEYLHELCVFPRGKHDDQVDSTSQALDYIKASCAEPGIFAYYRGELAARGNRNLER